MRNSLRGALLSGLVFPGLGQFKLKYYGRGAAIMVVTSACLVAIFLKMLQQAFAIMAMLESKDAMVSMGAISTAAVQAVTALESPLFKSLYVLVIFFWCIGIVDAYAIGRKADLESRIGNQVPEKQG